MHVYELMAKTESMVRDMHLEGKSVLTAYPTRTFRINKGISACRIKLIVGPSSSPIIDRVYEQGNDSSIYQAGSDANLEPDERGWRRIHPR